MRAFIALLRPSRFLPPGHGLPVLLLLLALAALGIARDAVRAARALWDELRLPAVVYREPMGRGVAISLNGLEQQAGRAPSLPPFDFRGVLRDRARHDWVLFGEEDPSRSPLSLDAIAIALRALRVELEAPGIDIRPAGDGATAATQAVTYFGGVRDTVVGAWFFRFDHWMKRASLGRERIPVTGVPVYWKRAVKELRREVATCSAAGAGHERHNRYWLCAEDVTAIEADDTMVFDGSALRVLAERVDAGAAAGASPCASRGTDDPLAAGFAEAATAHLPELAATLPVSEIETFARLTAGLTWLAGRDPLHDLRPWLGFVPGRATTPETIPTLSRWAAREHTLTLGGERVRHRHQLTVSGGVLLAPRLRRARSRDGAVAALGRAVLAARPAGGPVVWRFTFTPPIT